MARIEAKLALTGLAAIAFAGCQMQGGVPRVDHRQVEPVVAPLAPTDSACDPYKWAPWTLENNGCPPEVLQTAQALVREEEARIRRLQSTPTAVSKTP